MKEKNLKMALLTIHSANSYGGCLQACATQIVLSRFGEVDVINYKTKEIDSTLKLVRLDVSVKGVLRACKDLTRLVPRFKVISNFKKFTTKYINATSVMGGGDLTQKLADGYKVVICGSDQIWNPKIMGGLDSAYFLGFFKSGGTKKISFSSSAGSYAFNEAERHKLRGYLSDFDSIAVREFDTACFINELLGKELAVRTVDPTLLLTKDEWEDELSLSSVNYLLPNKYILVYTLKKDGLVRKVVNSFAKKLGLKVVVIDQDPLLFYKHDIHLNSASPELFVKAFIGAEFVVTNSFHGAAFSINFNRRFVAIRPESGLNRVKSLLGEVGFSSKLIESEQDIKGFDCDNYDYAFANNALNRMRSETFNYLERSVV